MVEPLMLTVYRCIREQRLILSSDTMILLQGIRGTLEPVDPLEMIPGSAVFPPRKPSSYSDDSRSSHVIRVQNSSESSRPGTVGAGHNLPLRMWH